MRAIQHVPINSPGYFQLFAGALRNPVDDVGYNSPWIYYDRLTAAAGAVAGTLFFMQTGLSATKTLTATNLEQNGQLPPPERALVVGMRFQMRDNMAAADISNFGYLSVARMYVGKSVYAEAPLHAFPGGGGLAGTTTALTANGIQDPQAVNAWGRDGGVPIGMDQSFRVEVIVPTTFTTVGAGHDVSCLWNAWRVREVS